MTLAWRHGHALLRRLSLVQPVARDPAAGRPGPPARSGAASRRGSRTQGSRRAGTAAVRRRRGGAAGTGTGAGRPRARGRCHASPRGVPRHVRRCATRRGALRAPGAAARSRRSRLPAASRRTHRGTPQARAARGLGNARPVARARTSAVPGAAALRRSSGLCLHPVLGAKFRMVELPRDVNGSRIRRVEVVWPHLRLA